MPFNERSNTDLVTAITNRRRVVVTALYNPDLVNQMDMINEENKFLEHMPVNLPFSGTEGFPFIYEYTMETDSEREKYSIKTLYRDEVQGEGTNEKDLFITVPFGFVAAEVGYS